MSVLTIETKIEIIFHLDWAVKISEDTPFRDLILAVFTEFHQDALLWPGIEEAYMHLSASEVVEALDQHLMDNDMEGHNRVPITFRSMIEQMEYKDQATVNDWLGLDDEDQYSFIEDFRAMFEVKPATYSVKT